MTLYLLRALFVLMMAGIGYFYLSQRMGPFGPGNSAPLSVAVGVALLTLAIDVFSSRRKLLGLSAVLFGTLIGMLIANALGLVAAWLVDQYVPMGGEVKTSLTEFLKTMLYLVCCYIAISFIMQTKDDFRFIIPYVAFSKQVRGARPMVLDTSVLVDGRILDLVDMGMVDNRIIVPRFVLDELQVLADSSDKLRRGKGRRGLEVLAKLQSNRRIELVIYENVQESPEIPVDMQLVMLASELDGKVVTTDFNLNKVAQLRGVAAINLNDLATAMKPVVLPGERVTVQVIKPGEQPGQAVGYLEDGTMVVVEQSRQHIGEGDLNVTVTGIVQTSAGRMVFARINEEPKRIANRRPEIAAEPPKSTP